MVAVYVQLYIDILSTQFGRVAGDRLLDVSIKAFPVVRFETFMLMVGYDGSYAIQELWLIGRKPKMCMSSSR